MLERTARDLEIPQVLAQIRACCLSSEGRSRLENPVLMKDAQSIAERQDLVESIMAILSEHSRTGLEQFPDIGPVLAKLQDTPYGTLDAAEVFLVGQYLQSAVAMSDFLALECTDPKVALHPVNTLIGDISDGLVGLKNEISNVLEYPGQVKRTHPAVAAAMAEIERQRAKRTAFGNSLMRSNAQLMQSDVASYRNDRVVVPLKAEHRAALPGLVHGASSSGQTLYVEPLAMVEYNNNVVMAQQELELVIARLVGELSARVAQNEMELRALVHAVSQADELCAIAFWARGHNCCRTALSEDFSVHLLKCRHPLLKKAVPITLDLQSPVNALVISGPNAGGKTVTVKTVGVMACLNQICGFIPASEGSALPVYDGVFTDIGDDQSIDADLSTFSGHMKQVGFVLRTMTSRSLVILDELGSGTDEVEGSAIAKAVLEYCVKKAGTTLVTSHHNALKQFAYAADSVMNAAMEFDETSAKPTFRVVPGLSGESHALDTARRMHLPREVLHSAREYLGKDQINVSSLIRDLEQKRLEADRLTEELEKKRDEIALKARQNELRSLTLDQKEYQLKKGRMNELDSYLANSRRELEALVRELREGEITAEKTRRAKAFMEKSRQEAQELEQKLEQKRRSIESRQATDQPGTISPGQAVLCGPSRREGTVIRYEGDDKWQVAVGAMRFTMKTADLKPVTARPVPKPQIQYSTSGMQPKLVIDVRGLTLEEALEKLSRQIESCTVHGLKSFAVIHGLGDGILGRGIHRYLGSERLVGSFNYALPDDGGHGKTYVNLV